MLHWIMVKFRKAHPKRVASPYVLLRNISLHSLVKVQHSIHLSRTCVLFGRFPQFPDPSPWLASSSGRFPSRPPLSYSSSFHTTDCMAASLHGCLLRGADIALPSLQAAWLNPDYCPAWILPYILVLMADHFTTHGIASCCFLS